MTKKYRKSIILFLYLYCIYTIFYIFIYEDFLSMFKNAFYFYFSSFVSTYPHVSWLQTSLFPFSTI